MSVGVQSSLCWVFRMLAWQVLYNAFGLVLDGKPHDFSIFGFVMAKDLGDVDRQVTRIAMQHPTILRHEGDPGSLVFNPHEVYERPDLGVLTNESLEIELESK